MHVQALHLCRQAGSHVSATFQGPLALLSKPGGKLTQRMQSQPVSYLVCGWVRELPLEGCACCSYPCTPSLPDGHAMPCREGRG